MSVLADYRALLICLGVSGLLLGSGARAQAPASAADGKAVRAVIAATQHAVISSELAARIETMPLDSGERFRKGDSLVSFDCSTYRATLTEAMATLKAAELTAENARELNRLNSGSKLATALAEAEVDKAKAKVEVSRAPVNRCVIRAPFTGRVISRRAQPHEYVSPGQAVVEVLDDENLEVRLLLPSGWLRWVKVGHGFDLIVDETGQSHPGSISRLGARIDPVSQTIEAFGKLTQRPASLTAGMSGTAYLR
jgi:membrane fusion protein (multidrug efflux system)